MEKDKEEKKELEISQELKDFVIARLDSSLSDRVITFADGQELYTRAELIEHVKKEDNIGRRVIDLEVSYLNALKNGTLLDDLISL